MLCTQKCWATLSVWDCRYVITLSIQFRKNVPQHFNTGEDFQDEFASTAVNYTLKNKHGSVEEPFLNL